MKEKREFNWGNILAIFGIGFPIYAIFAPKSIQKELLEYTGKLIGLLIALAVLYFVWGVIKDKQRHKNKE